MTPETEEMATSAANEGFALSSLTACFNFSYTPKRAVEYVSCRRREAESCIWRSQHLIGDEYNELVQHTPLYRPLMPLSL